MQREIIAGVGIQGSYVNADRHSNLFFVLPFFLTWDVVILSFHSSACIKKNRRRKLSRILYRRLKLPHLLLLERQAEPVECLDTVAVDVVGDEPALSG